MVLKLFKNYDYNFNFIDYIRVLILVFIVGGITGYIYEEIFYFITDGVLINRGVLFGPFLPVYAFGALFMFLFLDKLRRHPFLIFFLSMFITGILEYLTGYYLLTFNNERLWDYTGLFLNIDGFVCLRSVVSFAIGGLILIYVASPVIKKIVSSRKVIANIIIIVFVILFIVDIVLVNIYR